MKIAFCTNIAPVANPDGLRGRNHAIVERLASAGHDVEILHGPEALLRGGDEQPFDVGMLCPNDLVEQRPDPAGRLRADTVAMALELTGVPFLNSPAMRPFSTNKLLTHISLARAGLRQPQAWTLAELEEMAWPQRGVIVKPVRGSGGLGVALARTPEEVAEHVAATSEQCFVQELVPDARCIRVVATRDVAIGRYEKRVPRGTLVATVSSGGEEIVLAPRRDLDDLAVAMTRAVAMDIAGVDILETSDGSLFALEVNANFGFYPRNGEIVDALVEQLLAVVANTTLLLPGGLWP
jgi:glutathione synthase/RimK-type ligase-like ATP-grasp enzyme